MCQNYVVYHGSSILAQPPSTALVSTDHLEPRATLIALPYAELCDVGSYPRIHKSEITAIEMPSLG